MSNPEMRLSVSLAPHDKSRFTTNKMMWAVVLALVPAIVAAFVVFGPRALLVILVSVLACMATEFAVESLFFKKKNSGDPVDSVRAHVRNSSRPSIFDGSAAITGILLAMNLPARIPLWEVLIGAVFSIGVCKMVFGGLGQNPFNPALAGRAFLLASFPVDMTVFDKPFAWQGVDAISAATPLSAIKEGLHQGLTLNQINVPSFLDLFIGGRGGSLGEVSVLAILAGGIFLLFVRVIRWEIPVMFLLALGAITGAAWLVDPTHFVNPLFHLISGGAMLGAWFMATDLVTSPMSFRGRVIFALGAGILCALIRLFGSYPEGTSYAILIMNALVPLIDRSMRRKRFGTGKTGVRAQEAAE